MPALTVITPVEPGLTGGPEHVVQPLRRADRELGRGLDVHAGQGPELLVLGDRVMVRSAARLPDETADAANPAECISIVEDRDG